MMKTRSFNVQRSGQRLSRAVGAAECVQKATVLGKILDLFMFREIRGAVEQVLGIKVSNGNGG